MMALSVVLLLVASLLVVEQKTRTHALSEVRPLDDDRDLPLPWAGHASTVFSLTALFGAYVGVFVLLGPVALLGVAAGGVAGLIFVRHVINHSGAKSFDEFFSSRVFSTDSINNSFMWFLLIGTQLVYATSEIVILRELALHAFGLAPRQATGFALCVALVAYLYCLRGGYRGVFRTDVLQLLFTAAMCLAFSCIPIVRLFQGESITGRPMLHLWAPSWAGPLLSLVLSFLFGAAMGAAFLMASPDVWKRVYVAGARGKSGFWLLVLAGTLPFLLLAPALLSLPPIDLQNPDPAGIASSFYLNSWLLTALILGMTASFLSSFDSALITAVHAAMVRTSGADHIRDYHNLIGRSFLAIIFLFLAIISCQSNPYLLGIILIGPYAILAGVVFGTNGLERPMHVSRFWLTLFLLITWIIMTAQQQEVFERPLPTQASLVPYGVALFGIVTGIVYLARGRRIV